MAQSHGEAMTQAKQLSKTISQLMPTFLRHMYPYVFGAMQVPPSQVLACVSIQERGGCTLSELRHEMHVTAPTITGIIDRLVRDGFVKRNVDTKDRRVKNVILTNKGLKLVEMFRNNIRKRWQHILIKRPEEIKNMEAVIGTMTQITRGFIDGSI